MQSLRTLALRTKTRYGSWSRSLAVVSAQLDKLSHFLALKIHNSQNMISYSATISAIVLDRKTSRPLWCCFVFRLKTPTQRAKVVPDIKLCFSCIKGQHFFRQSRKPSKRTVEGFSSSHIVLLPKVEKVFTLRRLRKPNNLTRTTSLPLKKESSESSGIVSQSNLKG